MRQALEMALEVLGESQQILDEYATEFIFTRQKNNDAIAAIKEALAQPEQEPVAWATKENFYRELDRSVERIRKEMEVKSVTMRCKDYDVALPIIDTHFGRVLVGQVSTPPQRKPLTDEEIASIIVEMNGNEPTALFCLAKDKPQRTWVGLTDDDIADCAEKMEASDPTDSFWREFTQAIEAKLKEKNT